LATSELISGARAAAKQQAALGKEAERRQAADDGAIREFAASPTGRARTAFQRGDAVFQYSIDVMSQQAIIVAMMGSATAKTTSDPSDVLNAVCREGWEPVNGSFVFVEQGQQSRDKLLSSGQNVAVKGKTFGYHLRAYLTALPGSRSLRSGAWRFGSAMCHDPRR
jgi:hypothetical protein